MQFQEEFNQQIIPPHTPYHLTPEQYENMRIFNPDKWERLLYCRRKEIAYELDPENDPRDLELIIAAHKKRERITIDACSTEWVKQGEPV